MLTVTIRTDAENTNTFEVQGIERIHNPVYDEDGTLAMETGVFLRYEGGGGTHYGDKTCKGYRFYVMNRYGKTIANYFFN